MYGQHSAAYITKSVTGSARVVVSVLSLLLVTPYAAAQVAPVIVAPGNGETGAGAQYIKQLTLSQGTPPITWSLPQHPTGATIDTNGNITGWTPAVADLGATFNFQAQASNASGSDTKSWTVTVKPLNNGFNAQHIFAIKDNPPTSEFGKVQEFDEQ